MGKSLVLLSLSALLMFMLLVSSVSAARESVQVTRIVNSVNVDGKWTTADEWSDTNRVSMYLVQGRSSAAYMRLKHDSDWLYLLVDFVSDTTPASMQKGTQGDAYDSLHIAIDKHVNDTRTESDLSYTILWKNGESAPILNGYGEVNYDVMIGMTYNATNDPDSEKDHAIYEMIIPMSEFEDFSAARVSVWDYSRGVNMHWPKGPSDSWNTGRFGDLVFSETAVPELPFYTGATLAVALLIGSLSIRREARRRS